MTARLALGLLLALASAAALNWGYLAQHDVASQLPPLSLRHPIRSLVSLFRSPRWLAGFVTGIGGWVLYVGAVALAPLSLVQAASAGGIGLLALLVSRGGVRVSGRERLGVAIALGGLVLLGISLAGSQTSSSRGSVTAIAAWMGLSAVVALGFAGPAGRLLAPGAGLGVAAGVLYAAGDVGTKAAVFGGSRLWFVPFFLACQGLAFAALQLGFQRGGALATAGVATLFTNALPIAAGFVLFGEQLPGGALGVVRVLAFAAVVAGAALLARPEKPAPPAVPGVVPYDPGWPQLFEHERASLERALAPWLDGGVHHVGSTAVPGLAAKPIVDMLAGVRDLEEARAAFGPLQRLGYGYREHRTEAHNFTRKGFALHLTEPGSDLWRERLAFRDALRADSALRAEYTAWKRAHATGEAIPYDASKWPLVARVLAARGIELKPDEARLSAAALAARRG